MAGFSPSLFLLSLFLAVSRMADHTQIEVDILVVGWAYRNHIVAVVVVHKDLAYHQLVDHIDL